MSRRRAKRVAGYSICLVVPLMGLSAVLMGSDAGERKTANDAKTPVCKALKQAVMPVGADGDVDPQGQTASKAKQPSPASEAGKRQSRVRRKVEKPQPLNGTTITAWRQRVSKSEKFDDRLQQRRELMYRCYREGLSHEAHAELEALLKDIAANMGPAKAHESAYIEASALLGRRWYQPALRAYALMQSEYQEGSLAAQAQLDVGLCQLGMNDLPAARNTFEMVANIADDIDVRGHSLRKLAHVQLVQCEHDAALATLDRLAETLPGTTAVEYAQMRKAFVLGMADRISDAIAAYEAFLKSHPGSRYGRTALRHLNQLKSVQVASAP